MSSIPNELVNTQDAQEVIFDDAENPSLKEIPPVPSLHDAMRLMETKRNLDVKDCSAYDLVLQGAEDGFVSDAIRAQTMIHAIAHTRASYRARDLRDSAYRRYAIGAIRLLNQRPGQSRTPIPSRSGVAPRATPRGIMVAAPLCTGRRHLADAVVDALGDKPRPVRVTTPQGMAEYLQLPSLRVQWPIDGKLSTLAQDLIGAIDTAYDAQYAMSARSPLFRDRDIAPALSSLLAAFNVGLLIVERINVPGVVPSAADSCWEALAHITRATGIPILCLGTSGAIVCSMARMAGAMGSLQTTGIIEIKRCQSPVEKYWRDICRSLFEKILGVAGVMTMPDWFPGTSFEVTLGYPGLLSKALTAIAFKLLTVGSNAFDAKIFLVYAGQALSLYAPQIKVLRDHFSGKKFKPSTLLRHSDWLSVSDNAHLYNVPELM